MTQRRIACFVLAFSLVGFAQVDSLSLRKDSAATPATGTLPVAPAAEDSTAKAVRSPVITSPSPTPDTPAVHSSPAPRLAMVEPRASRWSLEGSAFYGWRMGKLLDEEDRLTRQFKIVLVDKNDDSTAVNPLASGFLYQVAGWWKATPSSHLGLGVGFGQFSEHPASSYSSDLSEAFFDQLLLTARYRHLLGLTDRWKLFGEAALGWSYVWIERIPLVAAHRGDGKIQFKQAQLEQIEALSHRTGIDGGVHGRLGAGIQWSFFPSWSLALSSAATWDRIWFQKVASARITGGAQDLRETLSDSPWFWGIDLGFSVARDF